MNRQDKAVIERIKLIREQLNDLIDDLEDPVVDPPVVKEPYVSSWDSSSC